VPRLLAKLAVWAGWALLGALALAGLALSGAGASLLLSRRNADVAALVSRGVSGLIAGRLAFEAVAILPDGGAELRGLRLHDPDGHLVAVVPRARIFVDVPGLARRELGLAVELESPSLFLDDEPDGDLSLLRAVAPRRPAGAAPPPATSPAPEGEGGWALRLNRVTARGGAVRWLRRDGSVVADAAGLDLDGQGDFASAGSTVAVRLRAALAAPVEGPLVLDGVVRIRGDAVEVPLLQAGLDATTLRALGDGDLGARTFRVALTRLGLAAADARRVAPSAVPDGDVAAAGYAESDGATATAAVEVEVPPRGEPTPAGTARAAAALRLSSRRAIGFEVVLAALDPSRLVAQAPPGRLELTARGAAAGRGLSDGRGRLSLDLAPSRLRGVDLGPARLVAHAGRDLVEVEELSARLPGLAVSGHGRWSARGPVAGEATVEAGDLAAAGRALSALGGIALPPLGGSARARATLAGTGAAPAITARVDAPHLAAGEVRAEEAAFAVDAAGPVEAGRLRISGSVARAEGFGVDARRLELAAALAGEDATVSLAASLPAVGPERAAVEGEARLAPDHRSARVRKLSVTSPGARFALVRPAAVAFAPLSVDRLELADGPRRVAVSGGLRPGSALDLRLEVFRLDVAHLVAGLVPASLGLGGELSLDARATGPLAAPVVAGHLALAGGSARGVDGLDLEADARWDGRRRLAGEARLRRKDAGAVALRADLPLPLSTAPPREKLALSVEGSGWRAGTLCQAAGLALPVTGTVEGKAALSGTVASPHLEVALDVEGAAVKEVGPLAGTVALEAARGELKVSARTRLAGGPLADVDGRAPLDAAALLRQPGPTLRALAQAPLAGTVGLPGVELALLAGKLGVPAGISGTLSGSAALSGTPEAPRGRASLAVANGAVAGYRDLAVSAELGAEAGRTTLVVLGTIAGAEALQAEAALGVPVERLADRGAWAGAPLRLDATVPPLALARAAGAALPLAGEIQARLVAKGTLDRPEVRLDAAGKGVELRGKLLGDATGILRHQGPTTTAEVSLRPTTGGTLWAGGTVEAPRGLTNLDALLEAPATLKVKSDDLDLAFLPLVAPGIFRRAAGRLTVDLAGDGALARPRPKGTLSLSGGRLDVAGLGDWSELEVRASVGARTLEISRLEARRRDGHLSGKLSVRDLGMPVAHLEGRLELHQLTVAREGSELVTLDLPADIKGTLTDELLDTTLTLGAGTIRLPRKAGGALQSIDERSDIIDVDLAAERARQQARPRARSEGRPFVVRCHLVAPGRLFVKGDRPAMNLELKSDSTWEWELAGTDVTASGTVEVIRGTVEPFSGRVFHVERAKVLFSGAAPSSAQLDVVARYDNPVAVVTVNLTGPVSKPAYQMSSSPAMDEARIALLIATGRTEMNLNTSSVAPLTTQEAGAAVVSAAVNAAFTGLIADRLPVDQLSVESSRVRAGKYIGDRLFLGYAYRFEAKPEQGENVNEMTAQFQLTPRWNFELRYGDAQAGDGSLIWSRDY
jgi:translocation and assembly module TamB